MEPARIPLLLRVVAVQCLRLPSRRPARAASAHCAIEREGAEVFSRLRYRPACLELGLPVAGKSNSLNWESRQGVDSGGDIDFVRPTSSSGAPRCLAMNSLGFSQPAVFSR